MKITVFTAPDCPKCRMTLTRFSLAGVDVNEIPLVDNADLVRLTQNTGAPLVVVVISNSFPERGLALKEKHPELVGWPERKLGEVENYQNALSRQLPSLNSMSLPEFIDFILTPHVAEYVLEQVGTPLAEETMQLFMAKVKA
ncbi:hypothetical protein VC858_25140 [Citrobacter freundii]|nr:hypothetical protein [Citrobacter freundii]